MAADLFIIGDSHAVALARGARRIGLTVRGGPLGTGRQLEQPFWDTTDRKFNLTLPFLAPLRDEFEGLIAFDGPILSTIGFNSHRLAADLMAFSRAHNIPDPEYFLSRQAFAQTVLDARVTALAFYQALANAGRQVFFLHSPQRVDPDEKTLLVAIEAVLIPKVAETGATFVDIRQDMLGEDGIRSKFIKPGDPVHASAEFGELAVKRCLELVAARPQPPRAAVSS